jgi:hypothetical protein
MLFEGSLHLPQPILDQNKTFLKFLECVSESDEELLAFKICVLKEKNFSILY